MHSLASEWAMVTNVALFPGRLFPTFPLSISQEPARHIQVSEHALCV